jgi:hypothetical protein
MENDKAEHNVELSPMQLLSSYRGPSRKARQPADVFDCL